jgi:EAL domain-containing protein (putative c-di-GMP-specific phosphodiesterase class I)
MLTQNLEDAPRAATFGRRKMVPRVCVIMHKPHVRTFLCDALEELGLVACECAGLDALGLVLEVEAPDLVVVGLSVGGHPPSVVLERLARHGYQGMVLLIGNPEISALLLAQQRGIELGLAMMPILCTPYRDDDLRERIAALIPAVAPPNPPVDVAEAMHAGWFELWYQPKIDAHSLVLRGAEALIRMRHPTWGIVPPAYFIPDDGDPHFRALSEFVIDRAVADWQYFLDGYGPIELSINLPVGFLKSPDAVEDLRRRLPRHPEFSGLIVEINGTEIIRDPAATADIARRLRHDHIAIAVDDLGAEWPELMNMDDFPFGEIKVDRKFVTGCADDRLKQSVCRRIVDLARSFGARTVAEGVETRAEFLAARDVGFDMVQGFLFAKPMGAKKFARTTLRGPIAMH